MLLRSSLFFQWRNALQFRCNLYMNCLAIIGFRPESWSQNRTAHELIFIVIIFHSQRFSYNGSIFPFLWHIGMAALSPWHTLVIFSSTKGCSLPPKVIWFSELHSNFSWNRLHGVHRHAVKVALLYVLYDPLPWLAGSTAGLKTVYSIHTSYRPWNKYLGKKTLNWRHTQQLLL